MVEHSSESEAEAEDHGTSAGSDDWVSTNITAPHLPSALWLEISSGGELSSSSKIHIEINHGIPSKM